MGFNTAIAAMMGYINELYKIRGDQEVHDCPGWRTALESLIQLLAPFAPHITEEMWANLGHQESVHVSNWPLWDEELIKEEMMEIAIQVNGKLRGRGFVPTGLSQEELIDFAKRHEDVMRYTDGKKIIKEIYVPGRLVNLVVV